MLANPRQTADDLAEWIRRYFEENGPKCSAVVGLSGGKDSTVTAALCVKALGAGRVVGVLMPDGVQADIEDAREIARVLGIRIVEVNIHDCSSCRARTASRGTPRSTCPPASA